MQSRLSEEDIREVLVRAEAIHRDETGSGLGTDVEDFIRAAEESGLPREAVEKALRERLQIPMEAPSVGERVFAKSSDGCYYVAKVASEGPSGIRVKFLRGGEHTVQLSDLRACSLLPGAQIGCFSKDWGWFPAAIVSYDEENERLKVSAWWGVEKVSVSNVRLQVPKKPGSPFKALVYNHAVGFVAGVLASGLAWLFLR